MKKNMTATQGDYKPLSKLAKSKLISNLDAQRLNSNMSLSSYLEKNSIKMNVDKRTLKKWWENQKDVELKSRQRIETYLSDSFTSNTFVYLSSAKELYQRIRECSYYMIEAVCEGDMTIDKSQKIRGVYEPLVDLILEIHSDPNQIDLMDVVNREANLIKRCEEFYPTLKREFSIFYAACPQFMLKEEDILDISTVYTFCINIIPQRKLKQRRPDDIFMMPRIKGIRNIKQEIKRKHNSEKSI